MAISGIQKRSQEEFLKNLRDSTPTVNRVAEWIRSDYGYQVTLLPNEESPSYDKRMEFTDGGDLLIAMPLEVKQNFRNEWTSRDDFPFPNVTVMAKHAWDTKKPKPYAVIMVDKTGEYCVMTRKETFPHWVEYEQIDARDGQTQTVYQCPKKHCLFMKL